MSQNFKILFYLKKGKSTNQKTLPIYARVTINGEHAEWTVQRSCDPRENPSKKDAETAFASLFSLLSLVVSEFKISTLFPEVIETYKKA